MKQHILEVAVAGALVFGAQAHAELVFNGGFEIGSTTGQDQAFQKPLGWEAVGDARYDYFATEVIHTGDFGAILGEEGGYLQQFLPTVTGQAYELSYWLRHSATADTLTMTVGDTVLRPALGRVDPWTLYTLDFVATSDSTRLRFASSSSATSGYNLDDVSVLPIAAIPAPATGALAAMGMAALLAARRRRPSLARR